MNEAPNGHDLDHGEIDELDEIDGDQQLALIWCITHQRFEWHWIDREPSRIQASRRRRCP